MFKFLPENLYESISTAISNGCTNLIENLTNGGFKIDIDTITNSLTTGVSSIYSAFKNVPSVCNG